MTTTCLKPLFLLPFLSNVHNAGFTMMDLFVMLPKTFLGAYSCCFVHLYFPHSFPGHYCVVCSWIKILFRRNDRHNKKTCCLRNSSRYLQGQCHRATLKLIRFRTLLFMMEFMNTCSMAQMIIITRRRVTR